MKTVIIIFFSIAMSFHPKDGMGQNQKGWLSYTEHVNTGLTLKFSHPGNTKVSRNENARCVSAKNDDTNTDWCIWMADSSAHDVEQSIIEEKEAFKGKVSIQTDSVLIDHVKCLRVSLKSNLHSDPFKQIVFLTTLGTTFEIINNSGPNRDFDLFCSTLVVGRERNESH